MLIDMHIHECTYSADSHISLEQIITVAKARALDAVCITDHDSMGLREFAYQYSREIGFPVFVGIEFFSLQGDITAWGLDTYPDHRIDAQKFVDYVNAARGFCVSCHPFRNNKRGLEENLYHITGLHGIEVLNGSTDLEANRTALHYCRELGLKPVGVSDAHILEQIGKYATWIPEKVTSLQEFIAQLHRSPTRTAIWDGYGYEVVDEF